MFSRSALFAHEWPWRKWPWRKWVPSPSPFHALGCTCVVQLAFNPTAVLMLSLGGLSQRGFVNRSGSPPPLPSIPSAVHASFSLRSTPLPC